MKSLLSPFRTAFRPSRSWHYSFGHDPEIDFCLWVLERDGLHAPPFDRHPAGDGMLQNAGLDAATWWTWFAHVVRAKGDQWETRMDRRHGWPAMPPQPAALWQGAPAVGHRLAALAESYDDVFNERKGDVLALDRTLAACDRQLWKELAPYRRRLPPVRVVTSGYPGPVRAVMPPDTVVLAVGDWSPTPSQLAAAILDGMRDLAASDSPRRSSRNAS